MDTFRVIAKEVKEQVLNRIKNEGISVKQAATDAGISTKTIYTWLTQNTIGQPGFIELARLKRENQGLYELIGKLTAEIQLLKKRELINNMVQIHLRNSLSKKKLAKHLGISRSMLYYQHTQSLSDEEIKRQIEVVQIANKSYGHKRIALALKLNKKRIRRVMKQYGMKPFRRRPKKPRKKEDEKKEPSRFPNLIKYFCPIRPNIVWVSDFTYIKFKGKFYYLATIMDLYTREIIGWNFSRYHNKELVLGAFTDALKRTGETPLYLHSDQGSEYDSEAYTGLAESLQIHISMSAKASPWENGFQESFYSQFKVDLGEVNRFEEVGELIEAIHQAIYYYNQTRIHTSLGMSPVAFKTLYQKRVSDSVSEKLGT